MSGNTGKDMAEENTLVVIAHWDDEIISAWAAMLRYRADVLCVTEKKSRLYADVYEEVVRSCGGDAYNWHLPIRDTRGRRTKLDTKENQQRLATFVKKKGYNNVFTHHLNGDVGCHPQHRMIASLCYRSLYSLGGETQLFMFGSGKGPILLSDSFWFSAGATSMTLDVPSETMQRRLALAQCYKHDFERHYPHVYQQKEIHYLLPIKGNAHLQALTLRFESLILARKAMGQILRASRRSLARLGHG